MPSYARIFRGLTREEVEEYFAQQRGRLDLLTMFELLATEGMIRLDFQRRVQDRRKDSLSRKFRELHKQHSKRIWLKEDVLKCMEDEGSVSGRALSDFSHALKLRHWLAHVRHWHSKLGRTYTAGDVYDICRRFLDAALPRASTAPGQLDQSNLV